MKLELGKTWGRKLQGRVEGFQFDVGVLNDRPHADPVEHGLLEQPQLKTYAGGPVRRTSRNKSDKTTGDILVENMDRMNINILQRPFRERNSDILRFTDSFLRLVCKRPGANIRRVENLLQAIVRNPILKQEYGSNSFMTAVNKGFNRHLFDTGQMFRAIIAKAVKRGK